MGISANLANTNTVTLTQNTGVTVVPVAAGGPGPTGPGGTGVLELAEGAAIPGATPVDTLVYRKGGAPLTLVASDVTPSPAGGWTTRAPALTVDVPAGNSLVAVIAYQVLSSADAPFTATDPRGNVWTQVGGSRNGNATGTAILRCNVSAKLLAGQAITFTTPTGLSKFATLVGMSKGFLYPNDVDQTGSGNATGTAVTAATGGAIAQAVELAVLGVGSQATSAATAGAGWTSTGSIKTAIGTTDKRADLLYSVTSATGVVTGSATISNGAWSAAIVTFKVDPAPRLEGIYNGTTTLTTYPLGKPVKGGLHYVAVDNGTQRWRSDEVDPRDFAGDTAGTFNTGNSAKDTACLQAAMAACAQENGGFTSGLTLKFPSAARMYVEAPLVQRAPYSVRGGGKYSSILIPTPAMVDQWVWTIQDLCRKATRQDYSTEMDWTATRTGPALSNFSIIGKRTDGVIHGLRTTGSMDDAMFDHMAIIYLAGIGMRLGDPNPAAGLSQGGIVRESEFVDIRVEQCGSDTNLGNAESDSVYGIPAFDFCQAQDGVTSVDGSNQVHFSGLFICFNHGIGWFRNYSATEVMRRIEIQGFQLHANTDTGSQTQDLLVIEGNIQSFKTRNVRTNSAPAGKACILVKGHVGAGRPRVDLDVNISSSFGDGVVIEDADSATITGRSQPSNTVGSEIRIPATSTYSPAGPVVGFDGIIDLMSSNNPSVARKFSVAPNVNDIIEFRKGAVVRATTTQLTDKTHLVNTFGKSTGRKVTNTTTGVQLYAGGTADVSAWKDGAGATVITPV